MPHADDDDAKKQWLARFGGGAPVQPAPTSYPLVDQVEAKIDWLTKVGAGSSMLEAAEGMLKAVETADAAMAAVEDAIASGTAEPQIELLKEAAGRALANAEAAIAFATKASG